MRSSPSWDKPIMSQKLPKYGHQAQIVYFLFTRWHGHTFLKQFSGSGLNTHIVGPAFSFDEEFCKRLAMRRWVSSTRRNGISLYATNRAFVKQFREKYGRLPSLYASQGFDTAIFCFPHLTKPMSNKRMIFAMPCVLPILIVPAGRLNLAKTTIQSKQFMPVKW